MKLFKKMKDGGPESTVTGYWLIELKWLFSIVLLRFDDKSRNAYHTHAFNCINWLLKGKYAEFFHTGSAKRHQAGEIRIRRASWKPFLVKRDDFHKVDSIGTSWVLSFRGPWAKTWKEYLPAEKRNRTLTNGRIEV